MGKDGMEKVIIKMEYDNFCGGFLHYQFQKMGWGTRLNFFKEKFQIFYYNWNTSKKNGNPQTWSS